MIIDGNWWWNEANDDGIFDRFEEAYPDTYAQKEYKVMPMPTKYAGTVNEGEGTSPVVRGGLSAMLLVNKNIDENRIKLMEEFVTYVYKQSELLEFTKDTNGVLKGINYNYGTIYSSLNTFAQSSLEILEAAKAGGSFIDCFSTNKIYRSNTSTFNLGNNDWLSGNGVRFPISEYTTKTTLADVRTQFNTYKIDKNTWDTQFKK
jgi:hypothetical protein